MKSDSDMARVDQALADFLAHADRGDSPNTVEFLARYADLQPELGQALADHRRLEKMAGFSVPQQPSPVADSPLPIGTYLGGYLLDAQIGAGGMGTVYRATHVQLGRAVAIKVLSDRIELTPQLVDRFKREAKTLARLEHANIVDVHDLGVDAGRYFLVMEFVDGTNLRRLMKLGKVPQARALEIVEHVCQGLGYAHGQGVVHRDIKPENVLIAEDGSVKLADFGLAKVLDPTVSVPALTRTDVCLGTFDYMAPEQKRAAAVDARTDVYSLGVVLYELLTGALPQGRFAPPSAVDTDVDPRLDRVVLRALESEPERRYSSAEDFAREIREIAAGGFMPGARIIRVVGYGTDEELGKGRANRLRLVCSDDEKVRVQAWDREEVAVHCDDDDDRLVDSVRVKSVRADSDEPELVVRIDNGEETAIYVPSHLALEIRASECELEVTGLRAALSVTAGEGDLTIHDHRGALDVERIEDGKAELHGLVTSDFRIKTRSGAIEIHALEINHGSGFVRATDGNVAIGLVEATSSMSWEASTVSGDLEVDLGIATESSKHRSTGTVGSGGARLVAASTAGSLRLESHDRLAQRRRIETAVKNVVGTALLSILAFYLGWDIIGRAIFVLAVWTGVEAIVKEWFRSRRDS